MQAAAALLLELNACFNARDFEAYRAMMHEEIEVSSYGPAVVGREEVLGSIKEFADVFPRLRVEVKQIVVQADDVAVAEIVVDGIGNRGTRASGRCRSPRCAMACCAGSIPHSWRNGTPPSESTCSRRRPT
jgi:hypothetical protein